METTIDLSLALEDPTEASPSKLDEILEAQLVAVQQIQRFLQTPEVSNKTRKKTSAGVGRRSLRHVNGRI